MRNRRRRKIVAGRGTAVVALAHDRLKEQQQVKKKAVSSGSAIPILDRKVTYNKLRAWSGDRNIVASGPDKSAKTPVRGSAGRSRSAGNTAEVEQAEAPEYNVKGRGFSSKFDRSESRTVPRRK